MTLMKMLLTYVLLASTTFAADMKVRRNIPYANSKSERNTLDVYAPTEGKSHPIVIWIHGGGWRRGDKSAVHEKPQAFVDKGVAFVSVNYRFVPQVSVAEMAGDIAKAISWVHRHAEQVGGDPATLIVAGHSAGAHLAALVCTDERYLTAEGMSLSDVKGCIPVDTAVYDIAKQVKIRGPAGSSLYRSVFGEDAAMHRRLSPITHVASDKGIPSFLILHVASRRDSLAQSELFAKALSDVGVQAEVVAANGKNHGSINRDLGRIGDDPTEKVFQFLDHLTNQKQGQ